MRRPLFRMSVITRDFILPEFIRQYRDIPRISALCHSCPHHGTTWTCPPFRQPEELMPPHFARIRLIIARFIPTRPCIPYARYRRAISHSLSHLEERLRRQEHAPGKRLILSSGPCTICGPTGCTRPQGRPCRHPHDIRPTLQACGIDVTAMLAREFNLTLHWPKRGHAPAAHHQVYALLHS